MPSRTLEGEHRTAARLEAFSISFMTPGVDETIGFWGIDVAYTTDIGAIDDDVAA